MADIAVNLAGLALRNPVVLAAGTAGYISEITDVLSPSSVGAIVTKSITRDEREGNAPWRVIEVPGGMMNAVGLANVGLRRFIAEKLPDARHIDTIVIASIAGSSIDDYVQLARALDKCSELSAIELNVSCPNTADGLVFGEHPRALSDLLMEVRAVLKNTKMIVKLSPNVSDIVAMAESAAQSGADALTLINTVTAMSIDVETGRARLSNGTGGLSGPAIHPIAIRMVNQVYHAVARERNIPIIGIGGVTRWQHAAEFILAGATAVGIGTALFVDPRIPLKVARGLQQWTARRGCSSITELVGCAEV